jgi:hypothetical protein
VQRQAEHHTRELERPVAALDGSASVAGSACARLSIRRRTALEEEPLEPIEVIPPVGA